MRPMGYYIKLSIVTVALFAESLILTRLINTYIATADFFNISIPFSLEVIGFMALISLTFSLTVGAWDAWYFNLLAPAAIASGIMIPLLPTNAAYALIAAGVAFIIIALESYRSYRLKKIFLDFVPLLLLRFAIRGILFVFSILAGLLIILNASNVKQIDFGQLIANVAEKPLKSTVNSQLQQTIEKQRIYSRYTEEEVQQLLSEYGINTDTGTEPLTQKVDIDIGGMIKQQVNSFIEPYKEFVRPLIAILVFGMFQIYATISYVIYSILVGVVVAVAKKTGFLREFKETVEKKDLQF